MASGEYLHIRSVSETHEIIKYKAAINKIDFFKFDSEGKHIKTTSGTMEERQFKGGYPEEIFQVGSKIVMLLCTNTDGNQTYSLWEIEDIDKFTKIADISVDQMRYKNFIYPDIAVSENGKFFAICIGNGANFFLYNDQLELIYEKTLIPFEGDEMPKCKIRQMLVDDNGIIFVEMLFTSVENKPTMFKSSKSAWLFAVLNQKDENILTVDLGSAFGVEVLSWELHLADLGGSISLIYDKCDYWMYEGMKNGHLLYLVINKKTGDIELNKELEYAMEAEKTNYVGYGFLCQDVEFKSGKLMISGKVVHSDDATQRLRILEVDSKGVVLEKVNVTPNGSIAERPSSLTSFTHNEYYVVPCYTSEEEYEKINKKLPNDEFTKFSDPYRKVSKFFVVYNTVKKETKYELLITQNSLYRAQLKASKNNNSLFMYEVTDDKLAIKVAPLVN
ncbi:MAG: hypothetical protein ACKVOK_07525 [Flavobacteriales bacterium]